MEEVFVIRTKHYEFKLREKSVFVEVVERKTLNDGRIMTGHSGTEVCSLFEDLGIRDYQSFLSKVYGYRAGGGAWPEWNSSDTEAFIKIKRLYWNYLSVIRWKKNFYYYSCKPKS